MADSSGVLSSIFAACWKDDALKDRFISDPKGVLQEYGLDVPQGIHVKVVENADDCVNITLPAPPSEHDDLSDDELINAAAGGWGPKCDTSANGCGGFSC